MDSQGHSSTRSFSSLGQDKQGSIHPNFKRSSVFFDSHEQTEHITADSVYPSLSMLNGSEENQFDFEKSSSPDSYSLNSSEKQATVKRGRPRKYWPEYSNPRQNMYYQAALKPKHNRKQKRGEIPPLELPRQPRQPMNNQTHQELLKEAFVFMETDSPGPNPITERSDITRLSETKEIPRIIKHASRRVDIPHDVRRHTPCYENQLWYPTQAQIGSAFSPARGQSRRPCCHSNDTLLSSNTQKYNEPYYLPCYPLMIQGDQDASHHPAYGHGNRNQYDACYHISQMNYGLANQDDIMEKPSPKSPIIIDCFSLAKKINDEETPTLGVNQRRHYADSHATNHINGHTVNKASSDPTGRIQHPGVIKENQNTSNHNCMICHQIATGEIKKMCGTSAMENCNKCCYARKDRSKSSFVRNAEDTSESCWESNGGDMSLKRPTLSPEEVKLPSSSKHIVFKQEQQQEKPDYHRSVMHNTEHDSEAQEKPGYHRSVMHNTEHDNEARETLIVREERGPNISNAFNDLNLHKRDRNTFEPELLPIQRQEDEVDVENEYITKELLPDDNRQESWPSNHDHIASNTNGMSYHHFDSTTATTLYSPENLTTSERSKTLKSKWEAMYDLIQESDKSGKKSYFCIHCGRAFTHLSSLNNHIRTHTGQKPFRCRYCGKRFAQSGVLTAHLRTHTGDKPFKCVICGKRFAQTTTLANHIRTHTGQKPFSCKYCKRTFAQSSTRNKHELSHTKEKPFECKYCGRSFTQSATVMRHMRIHMKDTKYSCVHCGKTFAYLYSLDKHLDAHTH